MTYHFPVSRGGVAKNGDPWFGTTFLGYFRFLLLTANRQYQWPDKSGTVALLSDIASAGVEAEFGLETERTLVDQISATAGYRIGIGSAGPLTGTMPADLDTGVEAASTWYYIFVISDSNAVNPTKLLFSLSPTAPTVPVGYDMSRRLGSVYNDASSDFVNFKQVNKRIFYRNAIANRTVLANGSATVVTAISLVNFVPPVAEKVYIDAWNDGNRIAELFHDSDTIPNVNVHPANQILIDLLCSGQTIGYSHSSGGGQRRFNLVVSGYEDG